MVEKQTQQTLSPKGLNARIEAQLSAALDALDAGELDDAERRAKVLAMLAKLVPAPAPIDAQTDDMRELSEAELRDELARLLAVEIKSSRHAQTGRSLCLAWICPQDARAPVFCHCTACPETALG